MRPVDEPEKIIRREERIGQAEINVRDMFDKGLAEVLSRIGNNPYFRDLEGSF